MSDPTTSAHTHLDWREMERPPSLPPPTPKLRNPAAACAILPRALGVHGLVLSCAKQSFVTLLVTVLTPGFGRVVHGPIGLVEGILDLGKSDEEFT